MNRPEDIAGELPAPRDDEPPDLRRDIVDELSDHLHCALGRELHRGPNEAEAKRRVLSRFGDPRRIARKLWWDWMRERIMSQRIMLGMTVLMAAACLAVGFFAWQLARQSQSANAALLAALHELSADEPTVRSLEWNKVKVRLVLNNAQRTPAEGFVVHVERIAQDFGDRINMSEETGSDGIADFGFLRHGNYSIYVTTPWGERFAEQFYMRPGTEPVKEIACPAKPPETAQVKLHVEWPDEMKQRNLWVVFGFSEMGRHINGVRWYSGGDYRVIACEPSGELVEIVSPTDGIEWDMESPARVPDTAEWNAPAGVNRFDYGVLSLRNGSTRPVQDIEMAALEWQLTHMEETYPPRQFDRNTAFLVIGSDRTDDLSGAVSSAPIARVVADEILRLKPLAETLNHWTITLPDELLDQVRAKLAEADEKPQTAE